MYTAINTVLIAPCIVGKSNMFRRSHLNYLTTSPTSAPVSTSRPGIDFFSHNICEDHLIGDLLWRKLIAQEKGSNAEKFGRHALVFGDLAFQPVAAMSVKTYMARRVRWLRVRKFTVLLATLVEPGTECFLCSAYGAFALTTIPTINAWTGLGSWAAFFGVWALSVLGWCLMDWSQYRLLHSGKTVEVDEDTPDFARPPPFSHGPSFNKSLDHTSSPARRRSFLEFLKAWIGREALAGPIWIRAFWGGTGVVWRDRRFWVGVDMKVHEIVDGEKSDWGAWRRFFGLGNGNGKRRRD